MELWNSVAAVWDQGVLSAFFSPGTTEVEKVEEKSAVDLTPIVVEDKGQCVGKLVVWTKTRAST